VLRRLARVLKYAGARFLCVLMLYKQDLDFYIGDEAQSRSKTYDVSCPIKHAQINNWDHMERIWEQSIYQYLRVDPENHNFLLVRYLCWEYSLY